MTKRSPVAVALLPYVTCLIYFFVWYVKTSDELKQKGADLPTILFLFIPGLNYLYQWKYAEAVEKVTNGAMTKTNAFIFQFLLGSIGCAIIQSKFNEMK